MKRTRRATGGAAENLSLGGKEAVRSGGSPGQAALNGTVLATRPGKSPGLDAAQGQVLAKRMKEGGAMARGGRKAHTALHSLYKVLHSHFGGGSEPEKASGGGTKWVQKAFSKNKGALHRELDVAPGKKIPLSKLHKAEHSKSPKLRKRAQLAERARGFNHKPQGR